MPLEYDQFRCPLCGQHAPVDRVMTDEPFKLEQFRKTLGGKRKQTEEQMLDRTRKEVYRGSGAGRIDYRPVKLSSKLRNLVAERVRKINNLFQS
jgi:hypothetical protein